MGFPPLSTVPPIVVSPAPSTLAVIVPRVKPIVTVPVRRVVVTIWPVVRSPPSTASTCAFSVMRVPSSAPSTVRHRCQSGGGGVAALQ